MKFPALFEKTAGGKIVVSFRDIPECLTQGEDFADALDMAQDALITAMEFYFEDNRPVPQASELRDGEQYVELPVSVTAKVLLLNQMCEAKISASELARRLDTSPQSVNRLIDLNHATKIDSINDALKVLGKSLSVEIA